MKHCQSIRPIKLTRAGTVQISDNVGHARLVAEESSKVDGLGDVSVAGERLALATNTAGTLLGQKAKRTVTGRFKLAVRHFLQERERDGGGIEWVGWLLGNHCAVNKTPIPISS